MQIDENQCPLCGGNNHCNVVVNQQTTCWCMTTKFPKGIVEAVPIESRGKQCICQKCIDTYKGE